MATMDVAAWLRGLGLGQYEPAFRDNDIDAEILLELTAEDLAGLGVTSIGHRRKLLAAIAALREGAASPSAPSSHAELAPPVVPRPAPRAHDAERRQLTVMFVDLVGSTALSARLDPEELREVLLAYHDAVAGEVARFEGHVAKFLGDGVLAYFGWPQAHEDDAERAVRAGLAAVAAVAGLRAPGGEALAARVGIATGLVVVGDPIGTGEARERAVVGETPNLAARLQALAEPGSVVIGPSTRRLVAGLFELEDLGAHDLKGLVAPVPAWRVRRPSRAEGRFAARQAAGLTPLIGRDEELALLLRRWEQAKDGEGQVVLLSGEPGIGKSRIVRVLRERLADEPHTPLRYQCSPYHTSSALYPIIDQLERAAGFERADPAEARLAKLEALLARGGTRDVAAVAPLVADLLSVPTGERYPPLDLTPQRQKARTLEVLVEHLAGLAAKRPVLVVLEDAHWIDPSTEELFGLVVERARDLPMLVVVTFRPEFQPPWLGHTHVGLLTLNRLGRHQGGAMVERVAGKALPAEIADQIVAKTDGVPLFVEELTKAVLESGMLREEGGRYELAGPLPALAIPATLHDSLMARLDRLAPVKEVAQIGAVIGREFSHALLAAVADRPEPELAATLDQLVGSELIFRRGTPPEATYSFKHALVQDVAYGTLLKSRRQQLHARIAKTLETRFPQIAEQQPEVLGRHCTEAGLPGEAVGYWLKAGRLALQRSAMKEAVAQLRRALDLLKALPDEPERQQRELALQLALGPALIAAKGFAAPETGRAYARACELAQKVEDSTELFPALYGQWVVHFNQELPAAHEVARELLRWARDRGNAAAEVTGYRTVGSTLFKLGRLVESRGHLEAGLALYDPVRDRSSCFVYALDSRGVCAHWLSHVLLALGYPEQARARAGEGLAHARELAHPNTMAYALGCSCGLHQLLRDRRNAQSQAEEVIALTTEQGFPYWLAVGTIVRGWALAEAGQAAVGSAQTHQGLAALLAIGSVTVLPYFMGLSAEAHGKGGQVAEGLDLLTEALAWLEKTGECWFLAELHRLQGELLLTLHEPIQAEICFHKAIAVARAQSGRWWELRAATSLARLWADRRKRREAYNLLVSIYGWFTEGFDTPDLQDAKALLAELG